jgi:hypothetical protein
MKVDEYIDKHLNYNIDNKIWRSLVDKIIKMWLGGTIIIGRGLIKRNLI